MSTIKKLVLFILIFTATAFGQENVYEEYYYDSDEFTFSDDRSQLSVSIGDFYTISDNSGYFNSAFIDATTAHWHWFNEKTKEYHGLGFAGNLAYGWGDNDDFETANFLQGHLALHYIYQIPKTFQFSLRAGLGVFYIDGESNINDFELLELYSLQAVINAEFIYLRDSFYFSENVVQATSATDITGNGTGKIGNNEFDIDQNNSVYSLVIKTQPYNNREMTVVPTLIGVLEHQRSSDSYIAGGGIGALFNCYAPAWPVVELSLIFRVGLNEGNIETGGNIEWSLTGGVVIRLNNVFKTYNRYQKQEDAFKEASSSQRLFSYSESTGTTWSLFN